MRSMNKIHPIDPGKVYVASSWRNSLHDLCITTLRAANIECYDFKHDEGANFHWKEAMPSYPLIGPGSPEARVSTTEYLAALNHERAEQAFNTDFGAMDECDTCVLVLPCNRSAHLELGWFVGKHRHTAVLLEDPMIPELMYSMVDFLTSDVMKLLTWLGVKD